MRYRLFGDGAQATACAAVLTWGVADEGIYSKRPQIYQRHSKLLRAFSFHLGLRALCEINSWQKQTSFGYV